MYFITFPIFCGLPQKFQIHTNSLRFYAIISTRNFCGTPHLFLAGGVLTMKIMRSQYLIQLIKKMHNGRVKIITGIRRYEKYHL